MATVKKIVVCGGNGFLGSRICQNAVGRGWDVTSVSRSGEPTWSAVTSSPTAPPWSKNVNWARADILSPSSYAPLLKDSDYVVHSMGILLEADYKGVLQGHVSPLAGLQRAFSASKSGSQNPLTRSRNEDLKSQEKDGQLTYEIMNRDSAIALAGESDKAGAEAFCYISAADGAPVLPQRYIKTKREAESTISSEFPRMRGVFVRPGMLFDESRWITMGLAAATRAGAIFNTLTKRAFQRFLGAAAVHPQRVDTVAEAVVEALSDDLVTGSVEVDEIEILAVKAWRGDML